MRDLVRSEHKLVPRWDILPEHLRRGMRLLNCEVLRECSDPHVEVSRHCSGTHAKHSSRNRETRPGSQYVKSQEQRVGARECSAVGPSMRFVRARRVVAWGLLRILTRRQNKTYTRQSYQDIRVARGEAKYKRTVCRVLRRHVD